MQREILDYMGARIAAAEEPHRFGKPLRHELRGLWHYRVRDYRITCDIREQTRVVFVLAIKHRSTAKIVALPQVLILSLGDWC